MNGENQGLVLPSSLTWLIIGSETKCINTHLMTACIPLPKRFATLISAYATTITNRDDLKEAFYEHLRNTIAAVPQSDKLIILGNFNARVGKDHRAWNRVICKHGIEKCNSNGLLLLERCASHNLLITNNVFRLLNRNKTPWMHPCSNTDIYLTMSSSGTGTDRM